MRNRFLIFLVATLFIGCNNRSRENQTGAIIDTNFVYSDKYIKIDSIKKSDFEKYAKYDFDKSIDKSDLKKSHNDTLKFLIDSSNVVFVDTLVGEDSDELRQYKHIGQILNFYVVQGIYYESYEYFLVNKYTGTKYNMLSMPYLSPNNKYFLAISKFGDYDLLSPLLNIWIINKDELIDKVSLDFTQYGCGIEEIRWITDDKLAVKINFGTNKNAYGLLTIK